MQRQTALGLIAQPLQCLIALHLRGPQQIGGSRAVQRHVTPAPVPVNLTKLQTQRIVLRQHLLHGVLQTQQVQRFAHVQQHRLVPVLVFNGLVVEKPLLHRGQGLRAKHRPLGDLRRRMSTDDASQSLQSWLLKQVPWL